MGKIEIINTCTYLSSILPPKNYADHDFVILSKKKPEILGSIFTFLFPETLSYTQNYINLPISEHALSPQNSILHIFSLFF